MDLTKTGGILDIEAHWDGQGKLQSDFDTTGVQPDEVVFAESTMRKQLYRSAPFQPAAGHGTKVTIYVYPRIMFSFSLTSSIDDEFLAIGGRVRRHQQLVGAVCRVLRWPGDPAARALQGCAHQRAGSGRRRGRAGRRASGSAGRSHPVASSSMLSSRCPSRTAPSTGRSTCRSARSRAAWRSARRRG